MVCKRARKDTGRTAGSPGLEQGKRVKATVLWPSACPSVGHSRWLQRAVLWSQLLVFPSHNRVIPALQYWLFVKSLEVTGLWS